MPVLLTGQQSPPQVVPAGVLRPRPQDGIKLGYFNPLAYMLSIPHTSLNGLVLLLAMSLSTHLMRRSHTSVAALLSFFPLTRKICVHVQI